MISPDSVQAWATDETNPLVSPSASHHQNWPKSLFWAPICVSRFLVLAMIGLLKKSLFDWPISMKVDSKRSQLICWDHWGPRTMIFGSVLQILLARVRLSTQHRLSYFVTSSYGKGENFQGLYPFLNKKFKDFSRNFKDTFPIFQGLQSVHKRSLNLSNC